MPLCTYVNNCCAVRRVWCRTRAGLEARWTRLSRWAALWCTPASSTEARQGPLPPLPLKNPPMLIYSHITKLRLVLIIGVVDMRCSFVFCFIHFIYLFTFFVIITFFLMFIHCWFHQVHILFQSQKKIIHWKSHFTITLKSSITVLINKNY